METPPGLTTGSIRVESRCPRLTIQNLKSEGSSADSRIGPDDLEKREEEEREHKERGSNECEVQTRDRWPVRLIEKGSCIKGRSHHPDVDHLKQGLLMKRGPMSRTLHSW